MPISDVRAVAAALCVTGCGAPAQQTATPGLKIDCAVHGAGFAAVCSMERRGNLLILRHADGGFRRLSVAVDRTLTVADGAGEAVGRRAADGRLEIAIDGDRYRLSK